jgi:3-oxoacyl-[acyl-carrier protein] reductase
MDLGISGRVAFVTGGSRGMGRDVAQQLAAEGCAVAIVARTQPDIDTTVAAIRDSGGTAMGVRADISAPGDARAAVDAVSDAFGPPLIVVGQTTYNAPGDFADITDLSHYEASFASYTMSQIHLLHAVLPGMQEAGWGRFVHIGSATAKEPVGNIHHAVANTTRPSTTGLLKTVSDEYAQYGITVNTVAPGWIETANAAAYLRDQVGLTTEEERRAWMRANAHVPAARMGRSEEIASLIVYLCSDQAGYVNGDWIEVDGGHHRSAF